MKYKSCILTTAVAAALLCTSSGITAKEPKHATTESPAPTPPPVLPGVALQNLKDGNVRFRGKMEHPHQDAARREEVAPAQHPFAIVLGCADSRTPPEVIFDQGLGDLFVIRVAGNTLNADTLGSIEYAVLHNSRLIVVLGHESCGAVKAAIDLKAAANEAAAAKEAPGHILSFVDAIKPAIDATPGSDATEVSKANVRIMVKTLKESAPILKERVKNGTVSVVGAYYELKSGVVTFLPEPK
jgi:carbonic anhydrase